MIYPVCRVIQEEATDQHQETIQPSSDMRVMIQSLYNGHLITADITDENVDQSTSHGSQSMPDRATHRSD